MMVNVKPKQRVRVRASRNHVVRAGQNHAVRASQHRVVRVSPIVPPHPLLQRILTVRVHTRRSFSKIMCNYS